MLKVVRLREFHGLRISGGHHDGNVQLPSAKREEKHVFSRYDCVENNCINWIASLQQSPHGGAIGCGTDAIASNLGMAVLVSSVHSVAMIAAGGGLAWSVYRYLGLKFVSRSWFNLDATWAVSLAVVGALSLAFSLSGQH
jgi:hypothetical protein